MKKVLFATTALVASAGIASADGHLGIAISGGAEMGVIGGDRHGETQFLQSVDVRFSMSGETSGGLSFGATIDLDDLADMAISSAGEATTFVDVNTDGVVGPGEITIGTDGSPGHDPVDVSGRDQFADVTVFVSGDFGRLTRGGPDGDFGWGLQDVCVGAGSVAAVRVYELRAALLAAYTAVFAIPV